MAKYRYDYLLSNGQKGRCGFYADTFYDAQIKTIDILRDLMRKGMGVVKSALIENEINPSKFNE